jgi:hypothetical protein
MASELAEKIMKERPPGSRTIVRAVLRSPLVLNGGCANLQNSAAIVTAITQTIWHFITGRRQVEPGCHAPHGE